MHGTHMNIKFDFSAIFTGWRNWGWINTSISVTFISQIISKT